MATRNQCSVVGIFNDQTQAQRAVQALKQAGFSDEQIGVIGRDSSGKTTHTQGDTTESYAAEGAATGLATGAGIGALWGIAVISNILPAIGPAIVGGTLAAVLSSAAAGAAAAGLAGSLVGMGVPKDEADYYETEFQSGRVLVTVSAAGREAEALSILQQHGGYDANNRSSTTSAALTGMHDRTATARDTCTTSSKSVLAQPRSAATTASSSGGTVQAVEEQLKVRKTPVEGEVRVRKEVHTEQKTIEVPVTHEEIVIERRAPGTRADAAHSGQQEIRIPVASEEVCVEKVPVVREEVSVSKRQVTEKQQVSETLRKENIKVDQQGDVEVRDTRRKSK